MTAGPASLGTAQELTQEFLFGYERARTAGPPPANVVLEAVHAVRLAQQVIDDVRRRVQQQSLGHRDRTGDPLYGIRRVLLRGAENLTISAYSRMLAGLDAGDRDEQISVAWIVCQELRYVYAAPTLPQALRRLQTFYWACATGDVPELHRSGRIIAASQNELLVYFNHRRASDD